MEEERSSCLFLLKSFVFVVVGFAVVLQTLLKARRFLRIPATVVIFGLFAILAFVALALLLLVLQFFDLDLCQTLRFCDALLQLHDLVILSFVDGQLFANEMFNSLEELDVILRD